MRRGRALGRETPLAARSCCLQTHPGHANYALLGFRVFNSFSVCRVTILAPGRRTLRSPIEPYKLET